jgi:hypothetical protein
MRALLLTRMNLARMLKASVLEWIQRKEQPTRAALWAVILAAMTVAATGVEAVPFVLPCALRGNMPKADEPGVCIVMMVAMPGTAATVATVVPGPGIPALGLMRQVAKQEAPPIREGTLGTLAPEAGTPAPDLMRPAVA